MNTQWKIKPYILLTSFTDGLLKMYSSNEIIDSGQLIAFVKSVSKSSSLQQIKNNKVNMSPAAEERWQSDHADTYNKRLVLSYNKNISQHTKYSPPPKSNNLKKVRSKV